MVLYKNVPSYLDILVNRSIFWLYEMGLIPDVLYPFYSTETQILQTPVYGKKITHNNPPDIVLVNLKWYVYISLIGICHYLW